MQAEFQAIHHLYVLRALAAANEFGTDSATYAAYYRIVKALETSDPRKWLREILENAQAEMEIAHSSPKLQSYWQLQVIHYRQAIEKLNR